MVASLLYCCKFVKSLTDIGFVLNPYDPCVADKIINKKQFTVCFHVDNCTLSHRQPKVMDRMINWLCHEHESVFEDGSGEMTVSGGKAHEHLGMTLDHSVRDQAKVSQFGYVEEIVIAFDKAEPNGAGTKTSAAPTNLFTVNEDCEKLGQQKATEFHNLVAKTLHSTKRSRPDTSLAMSFLTTRVRSPNKDDWVKLTHLMQCLRSTKLLGLILSTNGSGVLKWWVEASFVVHPNMRGHSGGGLLMGADFPLLVLTNSTSTLAAPRRLKAWEPTTSCRRHVEHVCSWEPKATKSRTTSCSKTTRVPSFSRRTRRLRAASAPNTLTINIASSSIASQVEIYRSSGARLET
jgi:hypothetical protein